MYLNFFSNPCNIFKIICLFLPVLSLHCYVDFSLVEEDMDDSVLVMRGLLIVAASLIVEQGL